MVAVLTTDTASWIGESATVEAGGHVKVAANGDADVVLAAGTLGGSSGQAGAGISNATLVRNDSVQAWVGRDARVVAEGITGLTVEALSTEDVLTLAAGGGGGGSAGVAGSATVTVLHETTRASLDEGADIEAARVVVAASDETTTFGVAAALAIGGSFAVGAGADVAVVDKKTQAFIAAVKRVVVTGDVRVTAHSTEDIFSTSASGGGGGSAGIAGATGVSTLGIETRAYIGAGATVSADGNVVVAATEGTELDIIAGTIGGGGVGVGASAAVPIVNKTTEAFIGEDAVVDARGNGTAIHAPTGEFTVEFRDQGFDDFVVPETLTDSNDGLTFERVGDVVAGLNELMADPALDVPAPLFFVSGDLKLDVTGDGAPDLTDPSLTGQRVATAQTQSTRGVVVAAINQDDIESVGASAGGAGSVAVNVGGSVNVISNRTSAYVAGGARVNTTPGEAGSEQSVRVVAGSDYSHVGMALNAAGAGTVAVAPGADVTVVNNLTEAYVADGAQVLATRDIEVTALAAEDILSLAAGGSGSGLVAVGGAVSVIVVNNETFAHIGEAATTDETGATAVAGDSITVTARDVTDIDVVAGGLGVGFGAVGVGASVGVIVVDKDTRASVGDHASIDAKDEGLVVEASSVEDIVSVAASGAGGFYAGVAGGVSVAVIRSATTAFLGAASRINVDPSGASPLQSVSVIADNVVTALGVTGGLGIGIAGIGGAVDIGVVRNNTSAYVGTDAVVNALGDVTISAASLVDVETVAVSAGGGVVGGAGSVSVWAIGAPFDASYSVDDSSEDALATTETPGQNTPKFHSVLEFIDTMASGGEANGGYTSILAGHAAKPFDPAIAVDDDADTIAVDPEHRFNTGDAVVYRNGGGESIGGLVQGQRYYVIADADDPNTVRLAASPQDALAGLAIDLDASGATGTQHRLVPAVGGATGDAEETIDESAPVGAVSSATGAQDVGPGTVAFIGAGAVVTAGDDVSVLALETVTYNGQTGSVAVGVGGIGGSVTIANVGTRADAHIAGGAIVTAGGQAGDDVSVTAGFVENLSGFAFAGQVGLIGIGAQIVVLHDTSEQTASIDDGATIIQADLVSVSSSADRTVDVETTGGQIAGIAAGASVARADVGGSTTAFVGSATIGAGGAVGDLVVTADSIAAVGSTAKAVSAGIGRALSGSVATVTVDPIVEAAIHAGALVAVQRDVVVAADSEAAAAADSSGVTVGLSITTGVSTAEAFVTPQVSALIGDATIGAGHDVIVEARHNQLPGSGDLEPGALATAKAAGGGVLSGNGAVATAGAAADVTASVGGIVAAGGNVVITATSANHATANGGGLTAGVVGVGAVFSIATTGGTTRASLDAGTVVTAAGNFILDSSSQDEATAESKASAGGVASGAGADSQTTASPVVEVIVGANATVLATLDVTVAASSTVGSHAIASGTTVGGLGAGLSLASATATPSVSAAIGAGADLVAGHDLSVEASYNVDSVEQGQPGAVTAESTGSAGALLAGTLAGADASVLTDVSVGSSVGAGARLAAGADLSLMAMAYDSVSTDATGNAGGLFAAGGGSATSSAADVGTEAAALVGIGASLGVGGDLAIGSLAVSDIGAHATGASGQTFADALKNTLTTGLAGFFSGDNIPSILSKGGTVVDVTVANTATTAVAADAVVISGGELNLVADSQVAVDATSSMSGGATGVASVAAVTEVTVDADAVVTLGDGAQIAGDVVLVSARNAVDGRALADALVKATGGTVATAISRLDVGSVADSSLALVDLGAATVLGRESLLIEALNAGQGEHLLSRAHAKGDAGIVSTSSALAAGTMEAQSTVRSRAGMSLTSADLLVNAESTYTLLREPVAEASTAVSRFVEQVQTIQKTIQRTVCRFLPWPFNTICKVVTSVITQTIVKVVEVFDFSSEFTVRGGAGLHTADTIDLEGDISSVGGGDRLLLVNADGTIDPSSTLGAQVIGDDIVVDDVVGDSNALMRFFAPKGAVIGGAVLHLQTVIGEIRIVNNSDKNLVFNRLEPVVDGDDGSDVEENPDADFRFETGAEYEADTTSTTSRLDIANNGTGDVRFTQPLKNIAAAVVIFNEGGDILVDGDEVFLEVGDVGSADGGSSLLMTALTGSIGSPEQPFALRLVRGQLLPDGTPSDTPVRMSASAGAGLFLDVVGVNTTGHHFDPAARVDGIELALDAGSTLQLLVSASEIQDDELVAHPATGVYDVVQARSATGDVSVSVLAGDVRLGAVGAAGTASVVADSIVDTDAAPVAVAGTRVVLSALAGGIGAANNPLEIDAGGSAPGGLAATAVDDVVLIDRGGDLFADQVTSETGGIELTVVAGDLAAGAVGALLGPVTLTAEGSIRDARHDALPEVRAVSATLTALTGSIGLSSDALEIALASGRLVATARHDAYITETAGDLRLDQVMATLGVAGLSAAGSILDGEGAGPDLVAAAAILVAGGAIGTSGDALDTQLARLEGIATTGGIWIDNLGPLIIGGVSAIDGLWAAGPIVVTTSSPLVVDESIVSSADITLISHDSPGSGDDLRLLAGAHLTAAGDVDLLAGDDFLLAAGGTVAAGGHVLIAGDHGDADPGLGSTILIEGRIIASSVEINGGPDGDVIIVGGHVQASQLQITGGGGSDTIRVLGEIGSGGLVLQGGSGNDLIDASGLTVAVTIFGGAGDDLLLGGSGNDRIFGEDGADNLIGGLGADVLDGAAGDDVLVGDRGTITHVLADGSSIVLATPNRHLTASVLGGVTLRRVVTLADAELGGADVLIGGAGRDALHGGAGADVLSGGADDDALFGNLGDDVMSGDTGDDHLYGGEGRDVLDGGLGADILYGGEGDDRLIADRAEDRLIDWTGNANEFVVPGHGKGAPTIVRSPNRWVPEFLIELARADGAVDPEGELAFAHPVGGPSAPTVLTLAAPTRGAAKGR